MAQNSLEVEGQNFILTIFLLLLLFYFELSPIYGIYFPGTFVFFSFLCYQAI